MEHKLNTINPENLIYKYEQLEFAILGGIKMDILNSMRATIKVKYMHSEKRHTLDLYNDNALQRFLKSTAESLEIGLSYLQKATGALINELEGYRLTEIERQKDTTKKEKQLTETELNEAKKFLTEKELMKRTSEAIAKSGLVGEEKNALLMYIIFTKRKSINPLHIISLGKSGTGKSYLQEKVAQLIPEEDKKEITALSANSFYYQGKDELKHKLILLEDLTGAENSMYPIRELQSKKYIIKEVSHKNQKGDTITITKKVEGPCCIAACTTDEDVYEDNANRSFLIYLDDSEEQDEKIMNYQRAHFAGLVDTMEEKRVQELIKNVQRILKPLTVRNPFAPYLHIPTEVFKKRRTNAHYLQFIEAVTFYHQYQRAEQVDEETGEIYIQTTIEDIEQANELIKHSLLRKSDELNGATREHYERLKKYLQENGQPQFINREIRQAFRIPATTIRRYHAQLLENNFIKKTSTDKAKGYKYEIVNADEYNKLKHSIDTALSTCLQKAKEQTITPQVSQNKNGSLKSKKVKQIEKENQ